MLSRSFTKLLYWFAGLGLGKCPHPEPREAGSRF
jgi:hypothetical protein